MFDFGTRYDRSSFFTGFLEKFLPDNFKQETLEIEGYPHNQNAYIQKAILLGQCKVNNGDKDIDLQIFEVHHTSTNDSRVGLSNEAFQLMEKEHATRALIIFIPRNSEQYRFSLLEIELKPVDNSSKIDKEPSNPRRYSFLLGKDTHVKTPQKFLIEFGSVKAQTRDGKKLTAWEDLKYRFSVEVLTEEFYNEIYDWYLWASQTAKYPNGPVKDNKVGNDIEKWVSYENDKDKIKEHITRLIIRLMFVWFLKQKRNDKEENLVPDIFFNRNELKNYLTEFGMQNYYNSILQNLFFATLNRPIEYEKDGQKYKRSFANAGGTKNNEHWGIKNLYRDDKNNSFFCDKEKIIDLFGKIPYLNGGLFECLDSVNDKGEVFYRDGFSREESRRVELPNYLFFGTPEEVNLKEYEYNKKDKKWVDKLRKVEGIINILKKYNWTIDENSPNDVDIALDPELLGNVFEKLLTSREATGAYYTPKEIVNYMVEQSLNSRSLKRSIVQRNPIENDKRGCNILP